MALKIEKTCSYFDGKLEKETYKYKLNNKKEIPETIFHYLQQECLIKRNEKQTYHKDGRGRTVTVYPFKITDKGKVEARKIVKEEIKDYLQELQETPKSTKEIISYYRQDLQRPRYSAKPDTKTNLPGDIQYTLPGSHSRKA